MLILLILNFVLDMFNYFWVSLFPNLSNYTSTISTWVTGFDIPSQLVQFISLAAYFLPMGTIATLGLITGALIGFKLISAIIHAVTLGVLFDYLFTGKFRICWSLCCVFLFIYIIVIFVVVSISIFFFAV